MNPRDARLLPKCKCGRPAPMGKRKCMRCISTKGYKVTQGRDVRKGSNARGVASHKPDKIRTRRAKRQHPELMGNVPTVAFARVNMSRAIRGPKEPIL